MATAKRPADSELARRLLQDKELDKDKTLKQLFLSYAQLYDGDLVACLARTSIELDEKFATFDVQSWKKFVTYPIVKKYIDSFLEEMAEKNAQNLLSVTTGKPRDAMNLQKTIEERRKSEDNSKYIVLFVPQRTFIKD